MLLELKNCAGTLKWGKEFTKVLFDVACQKDGKLLITFQDIPHRKNTSWFMNVFHTQGRYYEVLQLKGKNPEGMTIASDYVYITSYANKLDKTKSWITIKGSCSKLDVRRKEPTRLPSKATMLSLSYDLLGFQCFGQLAAETGVGSVVMVGNSKIKDYEEATGTLTIKTSKTKFFDLPSWIEHCDKTVRLVLDIFSLAQDRYIAWTRRCLFADNEFLSALFIGPRRSGRPQEPLFHYLHLQPILNLSLSNYTEELKHESGFGIALEWFLMKPTYDEAHFLTGMTALEHLVYTFSRQVHRDQIFSSNQFSKRIRPLIIGALDTALGELVARGADFEKENEHKVESSKGKLPELNRYTFKENLWEFISGKKIPLYGIDHEIDNLIRVRDRIVHRGLHEEESELRNTRHYLDILREFLKRIFLTFLSFQGKYDSFLNGQHSVEFPSGK
jgi:hypothetical protein